MIFYVQKELILSLFQNSVESDTRMCLLVQIKKKKTTHTQLETSIFLKEIENYSTEEP